MSTRGAIGFRIGGKDKVTYNHSDSYPSYLGAAMLTFLRVNSVEAIALAARSIQVVAEDAKPTPEQVKECARFTDLGVSRQSPDDWYCLLRNAQGEPQEYIKGLRYMTDSHRFLRDSLFCEYAYIINLDEDVFEFYRGFNKDGNAPGRYAKGRSVQGYRGVALAWSMPLAELKARLDIEGVAAFVEKLEACDKEEA